MIKENKYITIKDLWEIMISNKKLFIISMICILSISLAYIIIEPPIYLRKASILIRDNSKGKNINSDVASEFENLGFVKENVNIQNEINIIKTPSIIRDVIKRLNLRENYSLHYKNMRWVDLYKTSPIKVQTDSCALLHNISFLITVDSENKYSLSDFILDGQKIDETMENIPYSKKIKTPLGSIIIKKNANFKEHFLSEKIKYNNYTMGSIIPYYSSKLNVSLHPEGTSILDLIQSDTSPQRADDFLNMLIIVYNEKWVQDRNKIIFATSRFIKDRLKIIEGQLEKIDNEISKYKSENLLPNAESVVDIQLNQMRNSENKLIELQNRLSVAYYVKEYLYKLEKEIHLLPSNIGIESKGIEESIAKYNDLVLKKRNLLTSKNIKNPFSVELNNDLRATRELILLSVNDLIKNLTFQIKNISTVDQKNKAKVAVNPDQVKYLVSLERQQKTKENLYIYLLQKQEENSLLQSFSTENIRVLALASGIGKAGPQKSILIIFSLFLGILIPIMILIINNIFNTTIKNKDDLIDLDIPYLGSLPFLKFENKIPIVVNEGKRDTINESFRTLRANLSFYKESKNRNRIILFTSVNIDSGKSFTCLNLAKSEAIKGDKTIIIDCDMRKASLSRKTDLSLGLSNYLSGKVEDIDSIIEKSVYHPNLDIIPVGKIPPNPSELLSTDKFSKLLEELRKKYNNLYIDGTPFGIISDTLLISKYCDITICVIRAGLMDKRLLPELQELYDKKQCNNLCVILNAVRYEKEYYYYKKTYYQKY